MNHKELLLRLKFLYENLHEFSKLCWLLVVTSFVGVTCSVILSMISLKKVREAGEKISFVLVKSSVEALESVTRLVRTKITKVAENVRSLTTPRELMISKMIKENEEKSGPNFIVFPPNIEDFDLESIHSSCSLRKRCKVNDKLCVKSDIETNATPCLSVQPIQLIQFPVEIPVQLPVQSSVCPGVKSSVRPRPHAVVKPIVLYPAQPAPRTYIRSPIRSSDPRASTISSVRPTVPTTGQTINNTPKKSWNISHPSRPVVKAPQPEMIPQKALRAERLDAAALNNRRRVRVTRNAISSREIPKDSNTIVRPYSHPEGLNKSGCWTSTRSIATSDKTYHWKY